MGIRKCFFYQKGIGKVPFQIDFFAYFYLRFYLNFAVSRLIRLMSLKLRYIFRLTIAFISRFKLILFLGVFLGVSTFFLSKFLGSKILNKKIERIGIVGKYQVNNLPKEILGLISRGLTDFDEKGQVIPQIASDWQTDDLGKTWVIKISNKYVWQDNKEIISKDINLELSDVEIEKPDSKTLVLKLKDEFSPFPSVLTQPLFKKGLLGAGEWKVSKISLSGGYVQNLTILDKNDNKKIFKFYPTEERLKLAFKLGLIDILPEIYDPAEFKNWKILDIKQNVNENRIVTIFLNTEDKHLSEKSLRQALVYTIKKEKFEENRAISPISFKSWAYNPQVKPYRYDLPRAKEMINELPKELKKDLNIKLSTTASLLAIAEEIVSNWKEAGINAQVQVSAEIPSEFQAFLAIFDVPKDPDQYALWHSTQTATNISKFKNPRIDKLLEDGRAEMNQEERRKIYLDFQRFLVEETPAIFLYHPVIYSITRR